MFCDHIGYFIYSRKISYFNLIGRLAFPIFAFQISEGFTHTKNLKKYALRLFLFAIISQIPFMLFHSLISNSFALNVLFTLLLGLICIIIYSKLDNKFISLILCIAIATISEITNCDYGFYGVAIVLLFYIFKNNKVLMNLSFILATIINHIVYIINYSNFKIYTLLCICTILSLLFVNLYNKKQGPKIKYFLYIFYPAHLLLIYLLWVHIIP